MYSRRLGVDDRGTMICVWQGLCSLDLQLSYLIDVELGDLSAKETPDTAEHSVLMCKTPALSKSFTPLVRDLVILLFFIDCAPT
jgi:hypothetical protein